MAAAIAHRGPDDEGYFKTKTQGWHIGLAHRRLSIIDLSTGHQPLGNEDGSVQIVFNGEIYNFKELRKELEDSGHRLITQSDTEVIVHAYEEWGPECVSRFRGMFAFAIWDTNKARLFLARDHFGKKPLFLYEQGNVFLFASEIKSLFAWGLAAEVNEAAIQDYFTYRYVPAPATLFKGVRKLMPGTYAIWSNGKISEHRYALPPDRSPLLLTFPIDDPVTTFLEKLEESVRIRMIADVPFGAFLSGGIDSSAVVGLMSKYSEQPIKTFSVGFRESRYSELNYAKEIANLFDTDHHELVVSQDQLIEYLPQLVWHRDAPVAEPSDIPIYLLSVEARKTVKMVLTGEGSDEFLGGYPKHVFERFASIYQAQPACLRSHLIEPFITALPYGFRRIKTAVTTMGIERFEDRMPRWFGALNKEEQAALISLPQPQLPGGVQFETSLNNSPLRRCLYFDQTSWLPDNLLERGDRMTMAASLEARMPFMDHVLAGFVSSLPDKYRVRGLTTKWILREAMKQLLPQSILNRPKVGFRVPVNEWFRTTMREFLYDHLTGADSRTLKYYHRKALEKILVEHVSRRQNHEKLLWAMLNLEIWHKQYSV